MVEAYNAFDSLRPFVKSECGSSLTDSLLERDRSFKLRGYCCEFPHYSPGIWGSGLCNWLVHWYLDLFLILTRKRNPGAQALRVFLFTSAFFLSFFFLCVCFKYSLFTFPPSICVFFFFYFGCARSSNVVAFSFFICVSHFVNPVLFFMFSFFSFHPFFCVVLFYWRLPFFFASSSFYLRFLFCLRLIEPSGPPWVY